MNLKQYLRADFHQNIRQFHIKCECEICKCVDDLHLHHEEYTFSELLEQTLNELNIDTLPVDISEYSDKSLSLIKNIMRGKQLTLGYLTLCEKCHIEVHKQTDIKAKRHKITIDKNKAKRKLIRNLYDKTILSQYLDSNIGTVFLNSSDRLKLIEMVNVRDVNNNRLLKGINSINEYIEPFGYFIKQFETSRTISGKKKKYKSAWRVEKITQ